MRAVLGADPDEHDLGILRLDVLAAVRRLEIEIANGSITPGQSLIRGRPLADWLTLDEVARLLGGASR